MDSSNTSSNISSRRRNLLPEMTIKNWRGFARGFLLTQSGLTQCKNCPLPLILMQSWARLKCAMSFVALDSHECQGYKPAGTLTRQVTVSSNRVLLAKMLQRHCDLLRINFLHKAVELSKSGRFALRERLNWQRLATESRLIRLD